MKPYSLPEKLEDGRLLVRETYPLLGDYDSNGIRESAFRFTEAAEGEKNLGTLEMTVAEVDIINLNRRFYSKKVFELAIKRAKAPLRENRFLGEVDHPYYGTLEGAAFLFDKVWLEGKYVKASGSILPTDKGRHLKALVDGGVGVQVSTRGYASMTIEKRKMGGVEVEIGVIGEDYEMDGIDFVRVASNPAGRVENESKQESKVMDLNTLKQENPELVAAIEAAAREGYVLASEVDAKIEAAKAEGSQSVKDSDEYKNRVAALASIFEAVKAFFPEALKAVEEKKAEAESTEISTLRATVEELTNSIKAEKAAKEAAEAEAQKTAKAAAVSAKVEELLKDFEYADLVRDELGACETVEAAETLFASRKASIESIAARAVVAPKADEKGAGKVEKQEKAVELSADEKSQLEALNSQRRIAGLAELKALPTKSA